MEGDEVAERPFCYLAAEKGSEYCDIPYCDYTGNQNSYAITVSIINKAPAGILLFEHERFAKINIVKYFRVMYSCAKSTKPGLAIDSVNHKNRSVQSPPFLLDSHFLA